MSRHTLTLAELGRVVGRMLRLVAAASDEACRNHGVPSDTLLTRLLLPIASDFEVLEYTARAQLEHALAELGASADGRMHVQVEASPGRVVELALTYDPDDVRDVLAWARRLVRNRMVVRIGKRRE